MSKWIVALAVVVWTALCYLVGWKMGTDKETDVEVEEKTYVDTIFVDKPIVTEERVVVYKPYAVEIPRKDTDTIVASADSLSVVELPIVQRHYSDSVYDAWVSGPIDPRLDSISVRERTKVVTIYEKAQSKKVKRWGIGIQAGYGYAPGKGASPYIGVGVSYNLITF